ncbi:MAG: Hpt domain-containing protein [Lachnospiraceae bacterium]|nr:Hpt domain-containing protein [Lachnospiraceae bacterium]
MDTRRFIEVGINYADGVKRFSGNIGLYEKFLFRFPQDPSYGEMIRAYESQDYDMAFRAAHTMKGVTGNLSLETLHERLVPFVEALRSKDLDDADQMLDKVKESYIQVIDALEQHKAQGQIT